MVLKPPPVTRSPAGIRLADFRLDRVDPSSLSLDQLCAAVDAIPGARLGTCMSDAAGELQLGVEVYDPASDTWRIVITLAQGMAWVDQDELGDRRSAAYRVVEQLTYLLDACFITEEGEVLVWGGELEDAA